MRQYANLSCTELLRKCAGPKRDEIAWAEFICRFHIVISAAVLRTAQRYEEPSRALLDDLVQDTYLKLCDHDRILLSSFRSRRDDSIYGFLKVVASNVVHDHWKSERAVKRGSGQTGPLGGTTPLHNLTKTSNTHTFDAVTQHIQLEHVEKILNLVTAGRGGEKKRAIFWLRHQQGLTAHEIAAIPEIGLTTEGVESILLRLSISIRNNLLSSGPHREVKVLKRKNRSNRLES